MLRVPYHLTLRLRQQGDRALLDMASSDGAGDEAAMTLPFGEDLPLVLRALDAAQIPDPQIARSRLSTDDHERLRQLGLWQEGDDQSPGRIAPDIHARVGRTLLQALTADDAARTLLAQARAAARQQDRPLELVLRFARSATTAADLPWEALWDDADDAGLPLLLAQGLTGSCVRYLTLPRPLPAPKAPGSTLRILAVSPLAQIPASLRERQRAALREALEAVPGAAHVEVISPEPPLTVERLGNWLQQHRPEVLSFYGHGDYRDEQGVLLLDKADGGSEWVPVSRLAPLLANSELRLLLLQACRSDQAGPAGLLSGSAGMLSALGVPAILAMQSAIRITAATRVQALVCGGLAAGRSLQDALAWARAALFAEEHDAASWYVPTLTIASSSEQPIFLVQAADAPADDSAALHTLAQSGIRRSAPRLRDIAVGAGGVATVTLLTVAGLAPLLGGVSQAALTSWLGGMGANALSGWVANWASKHGGKLWNYARGTTEWDDEQGVLGAMAADLEQQAQTQPELREAMAALLEQSGAIQTALVALGQQVDAQSELLRALDDRLDDQRGLLESLRADLRRGDLIQGRLHQLLTRQIADQTETLLDAIEASRAALAGDIAALQAELRTMRDEMQSLLASAGGGQQQHTVEMTGGNYFGGANIGSIGKIVQGDEVHGDKIAGDKIVNGESRKRRRRKRRDGEDDV